MIINVSGQHTGPIFKGQTVQVLSPQCCPQTSITIDQPTLHNTREERRLQNDPFFQNPVLAWDVPGPCTLAEAIMALTCIQEVPGSNLHPDTLGPCRNVPGIISLNVSRPHPSTSVPIHSSHSKLSSVYSGSVVKKGNKG